MEEETDNICFVCDKKISSDKWKYKLQVTATKKRNVPAADLIKHLVGEEYAVLVGERDAVCSKCMSLLNLMDSLTVQLQEVTAVLTKLLHTKYNLTSEINNVDFDNSILEKPEPLHKCDKCSFNTKYEKEFNKHIRTHSTARSSSVKKSQTKPKSSLKSKSGGKNVSTPAVPKQVKIPSPATKVGKNTPLFRTSKTVTRSSTNSLKRRRRFSSSSEEESASKTSTKKKPVMKVPPNKTPVKSTPVKKSPKQKKAKVLFQCSACDKMYPTEALIKSHAEKEHGMGKISVTEEEYADIQTLDSSDNDDVSVTDKQEAKITTDPSEETKLDFLDDWEEDENDEITSPTKKLMVENKSPTNNVETRKKGKGRPRTESMEFENEKDDTSSSPTCLFCHATFSSMESVQDHIKMSHSRSKSSKVSVGSKSLPSDNVASFEIDSTTDLSETKVSSANESGGKSSLPQKSYKCNLCGIKKVSLQFIQKHVKTHKRKISLQCKFCGITCRNIIGLKLHASRCHKVAYIPKKCSLCKFRFLDHKCLRNHVKKVHKRKSPGRKKCDKVKSSLNDYDSPKKPSNNFDSRRVSLSKRTSATDSRKISSSEVSSTSFETDPHNQIKELENDKVNSSEPKAKKLKCQECSSSFDKPSQLKNHIGRHRASKCLNLGICVYCNKLFLNKDQVVLHTNVMHENLKESPICEICEKTYSHVKDLKSHFIRAHWSEVTETLINQAFEQKQMKSRPGQNAGAESNDVYSKVFKELQDLTGEGNETEETTKSEHQQQSSLFYSCPLCNFNSTAQEEVKQHLKDHTKNYCNICNSIFNCQELIRHLENHSVLFKSTKCLECKGKFHDDVHLQFHIQHDHPGKKPHKCSMCTKTYFTARSLLSHKQTKHAKKSTKVLSCNWCKKKFLSDKIYQIHVEYAHRSSLNCKYCDKAFVGIKTLVLHEKNHLKQVKSIYKCNVCGKVLKNLASLKTHKINHGSNSSLQCEVCSKSFRSFHTLREHSAKHSDTHQMKYFCDICSKGFYFYDSHYRHRRIHLEPLRLQCKKCKESFPTRETLIDHKQICTAS